MKSKNLDLLKNTFPDEDTNQILYLQPNPVNIYSEGNPTEFSRIYSQLDVCKIAALVV